MKRIIYLFFLLPAFSFSQTKLTDADAPGVKYSCLPIRFSKKINAPDLKLPVTNLELIDARADTSKMGFFYSMSGLKMMKLCFTNGINNETGSFLNNYLQKNFTQSSQSLVLSIRKLWVGKYDTLIMDKRTATIQVAFCKVEFYLKESECYYPLYRFDSSIIFKTNLSEALFGTVEDLLMASLRRALIFDYSKIRPSSCISKNSIDSFNSYRQSFPVSNTVQPAKGVYLKFEQFKNNTPAFTDFELKLGAASDQIYVKGKNGNDSLITNAWGYCEGERSFCRIGYNYFPLFKCGKNFDLYGPKDFIVQNPFTAIYRPYLWYNANPATAGLVTLAAAELLSMIKTTSVKLKPLQLDMESGKLF